MVGLRRINCKRPRTQKPANRSAPDVVVEARGDEKTVALALVAGLAKEAKRIDRQSPSSELSERVLEACSRDGVEKKLILSAVWRDCLSTTATLRHRLYYVRVIELLATKGMLARFLAGSTKAPKKRREALERWTRADWDPDCSSETKRRKGTSAMSALSITQNLKRAFQKSSANILARVRHDMKALAATDASVSSPAPGSGGSSSAHAQDAVPTGGTQSCQPDDSVGTIESLFRRLSLKKGGRAFVTQGAETIADSALYTMPQTEFDNLLTRITLTMRPEMDTALKPHVDEADVDELTRAFSCLSVETAGLRSAYKKGKEVVAKAAKHGLQFSRDITTIEALADALEKMSVTKSAEEVPRPDMVVYHRNSTGPWHANRAMVLVRSKSILHDTKDHYRTHPNVLVESYEKLFLQKYGRPHPYQLFGFTSMRDYITTELGVEVILVKGDDGVVREEYAKYGRPHPYQLFGFTSMREYISTELGVDVILVKGDDGVARGEYAKYGRPHPYQQFGFASMREYVMKELGVEVILVKGDDGVVREEYAYDIRNLPWFRETSNVPKREPTEGSAQASNTSNQSESRSIPEHSASSTRRSTSASSGSTSGSTSDGVDTKPEYPNAFPRSMSSSVGAQSDSVDRNPELRNDSLRVPVVNSSDELHSDSVDSKPEIPNALPRVIGHFAESRSEVMDPKAESPHDLLRVRSSFVESHSNSMANSHSNSVDPEQEFPDDPPLMVGFSDEVHSDGVHQKQKQELGNSVLSEREAIAQTLSSGGVPGGAFSQSLLENSRDVLTSLKSEGSEVHSTASVYSFAAGQYAHTSNPITSSSAQTWEGDVASFLKSEGLNPVNCASSAHTLATTPDAAGTSMEIDTESVQAMQNEFAATEDKQVSLSARASQEACFVAMSMSPPPLEHVKYEHEEKQDEWY